MLCKVRFKSSRTSHFASLCTAWDTHTKVCPVVRRTHNLKRPAQVGNPLAHGMQPQVARKRGGWIEPDAIVPHFQYHLIGSLLQAQHHVARAGVLHGVMHRFLRDAVEILFDPQVQPRFVAQVHRYGEPMSRLDCRHLFGQCSVLPLLTEFGIATAEEVDVDTYAGRLRAETLNQASLVVAPLLIGAWTRIAC